MDLRNVGLVVEIGVVLKIKILNTKYFSDIYFRLISLLKIRWIKGYLLSPPFKLYSFLCPRALGDSPR